MKKYKSLFYNELMAEIEGLIILTPNLINKDTRYQKSCAIFTTLRNRKKTSFLLSDATSLTKDQKIKKKIVVLNFVYFLKNASHGQDDLSNA